VEYVAKKVRQKCDLHPAKKPKRLPRVLTADEFRKFYQIVDRADDVQHALMLRLMFYTGVRVSELCRIEVGDVDLEACKIFREPRQGVEGSVRPVRKGFATALRTHIAAHPNNRWLFQTQRNGKFTTRRVQQIVKGYAEQADVNATPHTFRHQAITWLTRNRVWLMPNFSLSRGTLAGKRWQSTSTSPWTGNWRGSIRRRWGGWGCRCQISIPFEPSKSQPFLPLHAGRRSGAGARRVGGGRVSDDQVQAIKEMKAAGRKVTYIARITGLSRPTVYRVLRGAA